MSENGSTVCQEWLQAVRREASHRSALILDGKVRDLFYDLEQRQYVTLSEFLIRDLRRDRTLGFTFAGIWDHVDGLRFPDDQSRRRFEEAVDGGGRSRSHDAAIGESYEVGQEAQPATGETGTGLYPDPTEFLISIRRVLESGRERPLFILDWSHLLVTQPDHPDPTERQWILHLSKAFTGSIVAPMDSDHLRQGSGLIILLTANLGALPPIIYQGDPRVRLLSVPAPTRPERHAFFRRHVDDLRCERAKPASSDAPVGAGGSGSEELAGALADLTDQLSYADLRQIVGLSMQTEVPLPPERLLNLYRFGDQRSPWEELGEEKLQRVDQDLQNRVIGQDRAIEHVATMVIRAYLGLGGLQHSARRSKPKGTLFFVGPTGVGKTELAKALAEFLFGDESACIRFDMSEFNHEHSDQRLVGAPPGYVGFEQGGQLTNAVRERPFCVLLFDEIEKAHGRVLDKFLQILEDGRLTDGRGETTYFSECVIIFTSNIGASQMPDSERLSDIRRHFITSVEDHFVQKLSRPELLNRLGDNIVVFDPIKDESFRRRIMAKKIEPLVSYLDERFGVGLRFGGDVEGHFLQGARSDHGGRGVVNALERDLLNPLARFLFQRKHQLRRGRTVSAALVDGQIAFDLVEV